MLAAPTSLAIPFDPRSLSFDYKQATWIEISKDSDLYDLTLSYVAKNLDVNEVARSFVVDVNSGKTKKSGSRAEISIGLGVFYFIDQNKNKLCALHQTIGEPVGTSYSGAVQFKSLIVFDLEGRDKSYLASFCEYLIDCRDATEVGRYSIFCWNTCNNRWSPSKECKARPIESVILSKETKRRLLDDIELFLHPDTESFYGKHGIPYRRSYLFYGVPGAGKTSLIQALAGKLQRNLYFLQPTHPKMTDDALRTAISTVREESIVVFEDIDALFNKDRSSKVKGSPLTFSGLLNALDGVGDSSGQLFILTTNLRDQLDSALIRNGRVDLHIEFGYALEEQMQDMWTSFYPLSSDRAVEFATEVMNQLGSRKVTTAGLQHFFIQNMRKTANEALSDIHSIIEEIDQRSLEIVNKAESEESGDKTSEDDETDSI